MAPPDHRGPGGYRGGSGGYHHAAHHDPYQPYPFASDAALTSHSDHPHAPTVHTSTLGGRPVTKKGRKRKGGDLDEYGRDSPPAVPATSSAPAGSLEARHGGRDRMSAGHHGRPGHGGGGGHRPIHYGHRYHYPRPDEGSPGGGPPRDIYVGEHDRGGLPPLRQRGAGTSPFRSGAPVQPRGEPGYEYDGGASCAIGMYGGPLDQRAYGGGGAPPLPPLPSRPRGKGGARRAGKELRRTEEVYKRTGQDGCGEPVNPIVHMAPPAPTRSSRRPRTKTPKALGMSADADSDDDEASGGSGGREEDDDYRPESEGDRGGKGKGGRKGKQARGKQPKGGGKDARPAQPPSHLRGLPSGGPDLLRLPDGRVLGPSQAPGIGWPSDQDERLVAVMSSRKSSPGGLDWDAVASDLGSGRSAREAHDRWTRYLKPGSRKGQWSEAEDALVLRIIFENNSDGDVPGTAGAATRSTAGPGVFAQWADLAPQLPGRTGKQIRDRWVNYLNPHINHMPFTADDDLRLWYGHAELGKRWVEISIKVFGSRRSENHIKNRWYSAAFKKFVAREFGPDAYKAPPACERREAEGG